MNTLSKVLARCRAMRFGRKAAGDPPEETPQDVAPGNAASQRDLLDLENEARQRARDEGWRARPGLADSPNPHMRAIARGARKGERDLEG